MLSSTIMLQKAIITFTHHDYDDKRKKQIQQSIIQKKKRLTILITKNELFKVELEMIQQEYDVRVGNLFLKDNHLDLEIIHYRNILHLMEEGLRFEDAVKKLSQTFYAEQLRMEKEKEEMKKNEEIYQKREEQSHQTSLADIKKLWKRLIAKFHPDLVLDPTEKRNREEILKQVNKAYEEYDLSTLEKLEQNIHIESYHETTVEKLEEILVRIENEIIEQVQVYEELLLSEWHGWKKRIAKASRKGEDIFKEIERKLLDDIVRKYGVLKVLKEEIEKKDKINFKL